MNTITEAVAAKVSPADARALAEHWQTERETVRHIARQIMLPPALVETAKLVIGLARGDVAEAKRVTSSFVRTDREYYRAKKWALYLLAEPKDYLDACDGPSAPISPGRPVPKNDAVAEQRAKFAAWERDEAAKRGEA